jgi:hypothetical protein
MENITLWFKVDDGPAEEVEIRDAKNVRDLKREMIKQHPRMFGEDDEAGLWHLYRSATAGEPEDSRTPISQLGDSGAANGPDIVLRRVTPIATGLKATDFRWK